MPSLFGGEVTIRRLTANAGRMILFVVLLAILAYVQIPYPFFPSTLISLQSIGVFLAAILLGPVWGTAAVVLFLIAGGIGLPVFHGGSGVEFLLFTPKSGYLLSYPLATVVVGYLVHREPELRDHQDINLKELIVAVVVGIIIMLTALTVGYAIIMETGIGSALVIAPIAFMPLEILKIGAVVSIIRADLLAAD